jgi:Sec-independent protein translocase protein TatA
MSGIGVPELLVITLVVALLFGAPILTFFMGYVVGKNRASTTTPDGTDAVAGASADPIVDDATVSKPKAAESTADQSSTTEEPADE